MKVQKITAKLRDAVPVCFMVDGEEAAQYKNIDLPDSIKELEMNDFGFNMAADGKITFHIMLNAGILPQPLPEPRAKLTRAEKAAMKAEQATTEPGADENNKEPAEDAEPASEELAAMELAFNVTGERRKELVEAVCEYTHRVVPPVKVGHNMRHFLGRISTPLRAAFRPFVVQDAYPVNPGIPMVTEHKYEEGHPKWMTFFVSKFVL